MQNMDTESDIVRAFMAALEANELAEADGYLADDFIFSGWTPRSLDKNGFLTLIKELKEGIPGLIFNLHNVLEVGEHRVTATWKIAGYQSDSFALTVLGLPPIPQMASSISMPPEDVEYLLANDRIVTIQVKTTHDGGIEGLLHQLGVHIPIP